MARFLCHVALVVLLASAAASAAGSADRCASCELVAHAVRELLDAQQVDETLVKLSQQVLCGQHVACQNTMASLVPEITAWLRQPSTASQLCGAGDVCGTQETKLGGLMARRKQAQGEVACGMCQSVVQTMQMELQLGERMDAAWTWNRAQQECARMDERLAVACSRVVDLYSEQLAQLMLNTRSSYAVCALAGLCTRQLLGGSRSVALPSPLVDTLVARVAGAREELRLIEAEANADMCAMCKMTVVEVHTVLADSTVQQQILNYTKSLCDSLGGTSADTCKFDVDIYGPAVFVLLGQYLTPDPICQSLHMCVNATAEAEALYGEATVATSQAARAKALLPGATLGGRQAASGAAVMLGGAGSRGNGKGKGGALMMRGQPQQQQQEHAMTTGERDAAVQAAEWRGQDLERFFNVWLGRGGSAGGDLRTPSTSASSNDKQQQQETRSWVVAPAFGLGQEQPKPKQMQTQQAVPEQWREDVAAASSGSSGGGSYSMLDYTESDGDDDDAYGYYYYPYGDYDRYLLDQSDGERMGGARPSQDRERALERESGDVWAEADDTLLSYDDDYEKMYMDQSDVSSIRHVDDEHDDSASIDDYNTYSYYYGAYDDGEPYKVDMPHAADEHVEDLDALGGPVQVQHVTWTNLLSAAAGALETVTATLANSLSTDPQGQSASHSQPAGHRQPLPHLVMGAGARPLQLKKAVVEQLPKDEKKEQEDKKKEQEEGAKVARRLLH